MATTKDCVQIAIEESPVYEGANTAATPYRISTNVYYLPIQSLGVDPKPAFTDRADENRGIEGAPQQILDQFAPDGRLTMRNYLNALVYLLPCAGWSDVITPGDGSAVKDPDNVAIPANAYRHVFTKRGGTTAKTMQLQPCYVNNQTFLKANGFAVTQMQLGVDGTLQADLLGLVVKRQADPNLTPSFDSPSIYHVRRGDFTLSWLASSGAIDDFTLTITNPQRALRLPSVASFYPNQLLNDDERVSVRGSIPLSQFQPADFDELLTGNTFAAVAKWKTQVNIGDTTYKYSMWVEMPSCQYIGGSIDELMNKRRYGGSFDFFAAWDFTAGYDAKITVVNAVSATETYT